ncbi:type II secretion system protein [Candidatus Woesebacteria bacterium]|nr:type II secretion system protein [Candidatus Woesebacteria bacterium]
MKKPNIKNNRGFTLISAFSPPKADALPVVKRNSGFTLIELLVVMVIMGILSAVGLNTYNSSQVRARDAKRKTDLKLIASALERYRSQESVKTYPFPQWAPCPSSVNWSCSNSTSNPWIFGLAPNYMAKMPQDPKQESGAPCGIPVVSTSYNTAKFVYGYRSIDGHRFVLTAKLENQKDKDGKNAVSLPYTAGGGAPSQGNETFNVVGCYIIQSP